VTLLNPTSEHPCRPIARLDTRPNRECWLRRWRLGSRCHPTALQRVKWRPPSGEPDDVRRQLIARNRWDVLSVRAMSTYLVCSAFSRDLSAFASVSVSDRSARPRRPRWVIRDFVSIRRQIDRDSLISRYRLLHETGGHFVRKKNSRDIKIAML